MVDTERFATTFAMLDKDGDGRVSAAEFKELMAAIGVTFTDEHAAEAIAMMDTDGDGLVSLDELAAYMSTRAPPAPPRRSADRGSRRERTRRSIFRKTTSCHPSSGRSRDRRTRAERSADTN